MVESRDLGEEAREGLEKNADIVKGCIRNGIRDREAIAQYLLIALKADFGLDWPPQLARKIVDACYDEMRDEVERDERWVREQDPDRMR
jgi:hypothetical protein